LTAEFSRCGNDDYEVLKLKDFQGQNYQKLSAFMDFSGPGKTDTFFKDFKGSVATLRVCQ